MLPKKLKKVQKAKCNIDIDGFQALIYFFLFWREIISYK